VGTAAFTLCRAHVSKTSNILEQVCNLALAIAANVVCALLANSVPDASLRESHRMRTFVIFQMWPLLMGYRAGGAFVFICLSLLIDLLMRAFGDTGGLSLQNAGWSTFFALVFWSLSMCALRRSTSAYCAENDTRDKQKLLGAILRRHCDFGMLRLNNRCNIIESCDEDFRNIMGPFFPGTTLKQMLSSPAEEDLLAKACREARCSSDVVIHNAALRTTEGEELSVEVHIVAQIEASQDWWDKQAVCSGYLVGVCKMKEGKLGSQTSSAVNMMEYRPNQIVSVLLPAAGGSVDSVLQSSGETSNEGVLKVVTESSSVARLSSVAFNNNGRVPTDQFRLMMEAGYMEHWIFEKDDVNQSEVILGQGGFGMVVQGELGGTKVAVKKSKPETFRDHSIDGPFVTELRILRHIRHPNVVLFFGAYVE
ncbi:unnamed protein product, partial [Polarella glacialis]